MGHIQVEQADCRTYRTYHDMTERGLSVTITEALAEVQNEDIFELVNDFTNYVDPDALDQLFRVGPSGTPRHDAGRVELRIRGIDVIVHADGEIIIEP